MVSVAAGRSGRPGGRAAWCRSRREIRPTGESVVGGPLPYGRGSVGSLVAGASGDQGGQPLRDRVHGPLPDGRGTVHGRGAVGADVGRWWSSASGGRRFYESRSVVNRLRREDSDAVMIPFFYPSIPRSGIRPSGSVRECDDCPIYTRACRPSVGTSASSPAFGSRWFLAFASRSTSSRVSPSKSSLRPRFSFFPLRGFLRGLPRAAHVTHLMEEPTHPSVGHRRHRHGQRKRWC